MQKMQILFPDPLMTRLRQTARHEDRPVSELVRRATEEWLEKAAYVDMAREKASAETLFFHGGKVKAGAAEMKELVYDRD